jgi:hypothetical protein
MKVLSFDVESNGLHGEAFAVGAVIIDSDGRRVIDEYIARCPISGKVDDWVERNVLPSLGDIKETCADGRQLRESFWAWYTSAKSQAEAILADEPYPVEARFLITCQEDQLTERYWQHPFPLLDLGTLLFAAGARTGEQRDSYIRHVLQDHDKLAHNPKWDAWAAAMAAFSILKI